MKENQIFEKEILPPSIGYFDSERRFHTNVLKGDEIYIYGGKGSNGHISNDFFSYNFGLNLYFYSLLTTI